MFRRSISTYMPYLLLILGLLETYKTTSPSPETLGSSKEVLDLLVPLAYLVDAVDTKGAKGKGNARADRVRHRLHIRLWRELRSVSRSSTVHAE